VFLPHGGLIVSLVRFLQMEYRGSDGDPDRQENPDQWIAVKSKKGRSRRQGHGSSSHDETATRPNPDPKLTLEAVTRNHDRIVTPWRDSECCQELRSLISSNCQSHARLTTAICLGTGSFDPVSENWTQIRTAHVQLEAFRVMVEALSMCIRMPLPYLHYHVQLTLLPVETQLGSRISCFIQEPAFTTTDRQFCQSLGFTVVDSPGAFEMIDTNALVFGVHLYIPTWAEALGRTLPGCYIGSPLDVWET
jgi:hypothetical protein